MAEISIHVGSGSYGVVKDNPQGTMHLLAQYIRHLPMTRRRGEAHLLSVAAAPDGCSSSV